MDPPLKCVHGRHGREEAFFGEKRWHQELVAFYWICLFSQAITILEKRKSEFSLFMRE
jgi:hypothetical protein